MERPEMSGVVVEEVMEIWLLETQVAERRSYNNRGISTSRSRNVGGAGLEEL